ncbi:MAG: NAD(P)-binding domain-containing protein, partial [Acidimicrobiia bacterium]
MGQNLALNLAGNGWNVSVFNRTPNRTQAFLDADAQDQPITGTFDITSFVESLARPRKILIMIQAGKAV